MAQTFLNDMEVNGTYGSMWYWFGAFRALVLRRPRAGWRALFAGGGPTGGAEILRSTKYEKLMNLFFLFFFFNQNKYCKILLFLSCTKRRRSANIFCENNSSKLLINSSRKDILHSLTMMVRQNGHSLFIFFHSSKQWVQKAWLQFVTVAYDK